MADRIKGITIEIGGDTTGLNKALSGVNSEIRNTQSQLKDVERLLKLDPTNTELLKQKQKLLADAVGETKSKLDTLKEANRQAAESASNYDAWKEKYDPIKQKIDETKKKLADLETQSEEADKQLASGEISQEKYDALQAEIKDTSKELRTLQKSARDVTDEFGNPISPEQYDALQREIIETESRLKDLEKQAVKSTTAFQKIENAGKALENFGGKATAAGKAIMPVSATVAAIGTAAVKTTADFDAAMSQVSAVSGATGEEFDQLRDKAREMGAKTKFSAEEAAEAMNYMAMAGWKTEDMLNGIEGIMNLAAASGEDLATTSDIVTDALTAFGLSAKDSGHFADILAAASSNANTNVSMMGESFKYVAPLAGSMGYSAEDVSVALGMMANSGIKASQAGTSLRSIITRLVKPTKDSAKAMSNLDLSITNADGTMKPFMEVMEDLRDRFAGLTEDEKAFYAAQLGGQEAMSGLLAIVNSSEGDFTKLSSAVSNCAGVTQEMADTMQDNLSGQLTILKSQLQEAAISIGDALVPKIRELIGKLQEWVDWFNGLDDAHKEMVVSIGLVAAAIGPLLIAIGQMATGLGSILTLVTALSASGGALFLTATAVSALGAAFILAKDNTVDYYGEAARLSQVEQENRENVDSLMESYNRLSDARKNTVSDIEAQTQHESSLWEELQRITDENGKVIEGNEDRAAFITTTLSNALGTEISITDGVIQNYKNLQTEIDNLIEKKKAEATLNAYQGEYAEAVSNTKRAQDELAQATVSAQNATDNYNAAVEKQNELQGIYNRMQEEYLKDGTNDALRQQLYDLSDQMAITGEKVAGLKAHMDENNQTLADAKAQVEDYNTVIKNYEGMAAAILSGDQEAISESLLLLTNDFKTTETATEESLQNQYRTIVDELSKARMAMADGSAKFSDSYIPNLEKLEKEAAAQLKLLSDDAGNAVSDAANAVKKNTSEMDDAGADVAKGLAKGIESGSKDVKKAVGQLTKDSVDKIKADYEIDSSSKVTTEIGLYVAEGLQTGIEEGTNGVLGAVEETATQTTETLKTDLSKEQFAIMGRQITAGLSEGIASGKSGVLTSIQQMCDETISSAKDRLGIHSPSTKFAYMGQMSGEGFIEGWNSTVSGILNAISSSVGQTVTKMTETFSGIDAALLTLRDSSGNVIATMVENAQEAQEALQGIQSGLEDTISGQVDLFSEFGGQAKLSTEELLGNMQSQVEGTEQWAENLRILAERGIDQGLLQKMAEMGPKGAGYVTTFSQMTDEELQRANALFAQSMTLPESTAESIMQSYKVAGQMTAQGFGDGITEKAELAASSAGIVANEAIAAMRETLEINSSSSVTAEAGQYFSEGFAVGITEGSDQVTNAVNNVVTAATGTLKNNLNLSQGDFSTFQTSTSSGWTTWAAGLAETLRTTLGQINTDTNSNLMKMQTTITTYLANIRKEWEKQLGEIQKKHDESMDAVNLKTTETMTEMSETIQTQTEQMKEDAVTAMNEMVAGIGEELSEVEPTIREGFEPGIAYITGLIGEARTWGNDMMQGLIQGLEDYLDELEDVCEDIADTISDNLHFTRPERGSLRNYEEWMPHFMQGLAKGIADNKYLVSEQIQRLADDMSILQNQGSYKPTINFTNRSVLVLDGEQIAEAVDVYLGEEYG